MRHFAAGRWKLCLLLPPAAPHALTCWVLPSRTSPSESTLTAVGYSKHWCTVPLQVADVVPVVASCMPTVSTGAQCHCKLLTCALLQQRWVAVGDVEVGVNDVNQHINKLRSYRS